jgi:hypothetical protein
MKKMFLLFLVTVLSITIAQRLNAQEKAPSKLFFAEFGGPGVIMSANLDSRFKSDTRLGFGFRLGAGFGIGQFPDKKVVHRNGDVYYENVSRTVYTFPAGINYIFGKANAAPSFEVGAGASYLSRKMALFNYGVEKEGNFIGYITFMYRITPVNAGMSFRIGFTPIIGTAGDLFPMGAIGFGYAF